MLAWPYSVCRGGKATAKMVDRYGLPFGEKDRVKTEKNWEVPAKKRRPKVAKVKKAALEKVSLQGPNGVTYVLSNQDYITIAEMIADQVTQDDTEATAK